MFILQAIERRERKRKKKDQASNDQPLDYGTWVVIVSAVTVVLCFTASIIWECRRLKTHNQVVPTNTSWLRRRFIPMNLVNIKSFQTLPLNWYKLIKVIFKLHNSWPGQFAWFTASGLREFSSPSDYCAKFYFNIILANRSWNFTNCLRLKHMRQYQLNCIKEKWRNLVRTESSSLTEICK